MLSVKDLKSLKVAVSEVMVLTKADKTANTPAWKNRDKKNPKTGEPIYKKADHLTKEDLDTFSVVKNYLLENGHAKDNKEAEYVMSTLDQKMIDDIIKI
tara:strand:+ start:101 stop:397 length:297 start_codon:yes stop_codon:yes gene_type:complete